MKPNIVGIIAAAKATERQRAQEREQEVFNEGRRLGRYLESQRILEAIRDDSLMQTQVDVIVLERLTSIIEATN